MENTVIQYILNNLWLFLPLGLGGIAVTLILFFTGARESPVEEDDLGFDNKTFFGFRMNVFAVLYFLIWIVLMFIGVFSSFIVPTVISGIIALLPLLFIIYVNRTSRKTRGTGRL